MDALTAWSGYVAPASVALPADILEPALAHVAVFCDQRVPDDAGDQIRLEHSVRGDAITIFERRPPWREDLGPEWTRQKIAQLRYDRASATWSLYWATATIAGSPTSLASRRGTRARCWRRSALTPTAASGADGTPVGSPAGERVANGTRHPKWIEPTLPGHS